MPRLANDPHGRLAGSDAVAGLILLEDGRYVLQQRDDIRGIWYPGHWGCFGGAVGESEEPVAALRRELYEELELELREATYFTRFDFDLTEFGMSRYYRIYYVVRVTDTEYSRLVVHEGQAVGAFPGETVLRDLRVTPYDAFALFLHHARDEIGRGWIRERTR